MPKTVNEALFDFQVAQSIRWIRLGNREAREAIRILNEANRGLKGILLAAGIGEQIFSIRRKKVLQRQIEELLDSIHSELGKEITNTAKEVAVLSADIESGAITRVIPVDVDVITPNLGVLQTAATLKPFNGAQLGEWIDQVKEADKARTWRTVLDGITQGETTPAIIDNVIGTKSLGFKDGAREVSRRGVTALVRTSINHAANQGRQAVWEENEDIIGMVKWVSTLDTRTSSICRVRDGSVGPVLMNPDFKAPAGERLLSPLMARPPAHPNCRSTTVAVTKSWRDLGFDIDELPAGTRAAMNGQVPEDTTYFQWLKRQSAGTQVEALGDARYKLWKKGGITPEKFQNDEGKLLTLDQLRKMSPKAFEESGL